ncbi:hypothetical protein [Methylobacterium aquaticum]|uniref:Uncharacterized protein n=1 Tax=Methylobacterium aquaticum TaxID=270351 RepID=A0A0C6FMC0_9HYPH|nr:hypothetical protein [Methylobacterium aquaticum]BAQ49543.1 hypothetical protein Maq22A_1p36730 [Methylobacterium aquaticum]
METAPIAAIAATLTHAFETGRVCDLVGRGARARVLRIQELVEGGILPPLTGLQLAREAEELALCFSPLPEEVTNDR